ncbi:MAG: transposase [Polyangiaceae bacterium]
MPPWRVRAAHRASCACRPSASRSIEVGPHEALFIDARGYAKTQAYRDDRRKRLGVERQMARAARRGGRFARLLGQAKVRVQVALVAAVSNLARLAPRRRDKFTTAQFPDEFLVPRARQTAALGTRCHEPFDA